GGQFLARARLSGQGDRVRASRGSFHEAPQFLSALAHSNDFTMKRLEHDPLSLTASPIECPKMLNLLELEAPQVTAIEDLTGNLKGQLGDFLNVAFRGSRQDGPCLQRELLSQLRQLLAHLE